MELFDVVIMSGHGTTNRIFGWLVLALFFGGLAFPVQASYVTSLSDTMGSQRTSVSSNHTISFVARSGAVEGSNMTISLATAFDTSGIDFEDVDVTDDGIDLTLAANCFGTEEASVSVAADVMTVAICAGDGGAIVASSALVIEIGTHATAGAVGSAQITNPPASGTYSIVLGGSFGDRGAVATAITSPGSVVVSGTVTSGGGCVGGGCGGGGDTAAPVISNVQVINITETSATVTWDTNESATSVVNYGLTVLYEVGTESNAAYVTSHTIDLASLTIGTTYHFQVRSSDSSSNQRIAGDYVFNTLSAPDATSPIISDVQVLDITGTSARIVWATDETSTSGVDYGLTNAYEIGTVQDDGLVLDHSLNLTGLVSETEYHFRVRSADGSGNEAFSGDYVFTTLDVSAPIISGLTIVDITETSARVTWTTNEPATSTVAYGPTAAYERGAVTDAGLVLSHSVVLTGLTSNSLYHVQARSRDAAGNEGVSSDRTFTTLPDRTPPINVSDFTAVEIAPRTARLTWRNPPDLDFAGVMIVRRTDRSPTGPTDGTPVYDGPGQVTTDSGLSAGTTYRYGAYAYDTSGNFASGALAELTISSICGDGFCTTGESALICPFDCEVPPISVCGNGRCEVDETPASCSDDCGVPPVAVCGDGRCDFGEDADVCPLDCAVGPLCGNDICEIGETVESCSADCELGGPMCGNLVCELGEDEDSCPSDCAGELPPVTVGEGEALDLNDLHLLVANQQIELEPVGSTYVVLQGTVLWVRVDVDSFIREPSEVRFLLGSSTYLLSRGDAAYGTAVMTPSSSEVVSSALSVLYPDGLSDRLDLSVNVLGWGRVVTENGGFPAALSNALVTIFGSDTTWDATPFGETNPLRTRADGTFAWYAPNGSYVLEVRADEHRDERRSIVVVNAIVNPEIVLIPLPPPIIEEIQDIIGADASVPDKIVAVGGLVGKVVDYGYGVARDEVFDNPGVETAAEQVAAPAVAAVATASAGAAASAVGLANVLRFLFTQPLVFFTRRKRKAWGIVFNAITKVPIGLAMVRLYDAATNRLLQTRVTDRAGRYFFIAQPGKYHITVFKAHFKFPTEYMKGVRRDVIHLDVYHGEEIEVTDRNATVAANIPIDPEAKEQIPANIIRKVLWDKTLNVISVASPIIALVAVIITPTTFTIGLFVLQVALYSIFHWVVRPKKQEGWGIVYDKETSKPLYRAIIRIFEPIYGKLLEMQVTDSRGRYSFMVGPNQYRVVSEKDGYKTDTKEIDYRENKEPAVIKEAVALSPGVDEPTDEWQSEPEPV